MTRPRTLARLDVRQRREAARGHAATRYGCLRGRRRGCGGRRRELRGLVRRRLSGALRLCRVSGYGSREKRSRRGRIGAVGRPGGAGDAARDRRWAALRLAVKGNARRGLRGVVLRHEGSSHTRPRLEPEVARRAIWDASVAIGDRQSPAVRAESGGRVLVLKLGQSRRGDTALRRPRTARGQTFKGQAHVRERWGRA